MLGKVVAAIGCILWLQLQQTHRALVRMSGHLALVAGIMSEELQRHYEFEADTDNQQYSMHSLHNYEYASTNE